MFAFVGNVVAHTEPVDNSYWWDDAWWLEGKLPVPRNYDVTSRETFYMNGDVEIPVIIYRPKQKGKFPGVLFVHGRPGLVKDIKYLAMRLAARGFVVYAPDLFFGRDIDPRPIKHDYVLEEDLNKGLDHMMTQKDISGKKVCVYSQTRGGYYSLKLAVTKKRQEDALACYVSYYPHWQDPNAPEPLQVYSYAEEADNLKIPALVFYGDEEQYQRRRVIETAAENMLRKKRPVQLIMYPGVQRGFDFRPERVRIFADDLASKDAVMRSARFIRKHLDVK
ncbi:MAG: dienelactone hydrolase [Gammaproteobacteria bacterium]|nr:dienelactone hydrolase [Gammaproteobacteria bacterium]